MINPMLVEGQAHGGVVQGIGQALLEAMAYDEDGQLHDRLVHGLRAAARGARADHSPMQSHPVPAKTNVLGAKGCGEAGCAGALPARDERAGGRAAAARRRAHRHAGDAAAGLAGDPGGGGEAGGLSLLAARPTPGFRSSERGQSVVLE